MVRQGTTIPIGFTLRFSNDLPNGPYGNSSATGHLEMFVPPSLPYAQVKEACLKVWIESRGSLGANGGTTRGISNYSEKWDIQEIKFKGGAVILETPSVEGDHQALFALSQTVKPVCCIVQ
jgi:hypothetical protein